MWFSSWLMIKADHVWFNEWLMQRLEWLVDIAWCFLLVNSNSSYKMVDMGDNVVLLESGLVNIG